MRSSSRAVIVLLALVGAAPVAGQQAEALDARLSPDGMRVAFRVLETSGPVLRVLEVGGAAESAVTVAGGMLEPEAGYVWTPDGARLVFTSGADDRTHVARIGSGAPRELAPGLDGSARVAGFVPGADVALVELPGRWPDAPDLYRVDLESGARSLVATNDGLVRRWVVDEHGIPRAAVRGGPDGSVEIVRVRGDTITPIRSCAPGESCVPISVRPDRRLWVRTTLPDGAARLSVLDPITMATELVRADVSDDPYGAFFSDSAAAADRALLEARLHTAAARVHPAVANGARSLIEVRDSSGLSLHVLDRWAGTLTRVLSLADVAETLAVGEPRIDASRLAAAELRYRIETSDGAAEPVTVRREIERVASAAGEAWRIVDRARVPEFESVDLAMPALLEDPEYEPVFVQPEQSGWTDVADTVVLDGATLRPIRRAVGGAVAARLDFAPERVSGMAGGSMATLRVDVALDSPVWSDGAALEALVAASELEDGHSARVRIFDLTLGDTVTVAIRVTEAARVRVDAGSFDVWRVTITAEDERRPTETWLVRRAAPHYLVRGSTRLGDFERTVELIDSGGLR